MRRPPVLAPLAMAVLSGALPLAGCREKGRPDPNVRMAISHEPDATAAGSTESSPGRAVPSRLEVPPEVTRAYSGVRLAWKDASNGKQGTLDVPLGGSAKLPGSDIEVRADVFLPAFTMSADVITSSGIEPENPAARISVTEKGNPLFGGWIFTRFPDVHPFTHPRFSLRLEGGVRRS